VTAEAAASEPATVTAEAAAQCQIKTTIVPSTYTVPALVAAIVDYFEQQKQTV